MHYSVCVLHRERLQISGVDLRNDEIELLRTGEISDAGMSYVRRLVSRHHIIPYTHFRLLAVCVRISFQEKNK